MWCVAHSHSLYHHSHRRSHHSPDITPSRGQLPTPRRPTRRQHLSERPLLLNGDVGTRSAQGYTRRALSFCHHHRASKDNVREGVCVCVWHHCTQCHNETFPTSLLLLCTGQEDILGEGRRAPGRPRNYTVRWRPTFLLPAALPTPFSLAIPPLRQLAITGLRCFYQVCVCEHAEARQPACTPPPSHTLFLPFHSSRLFMARFRLRSHTVGQVYDVQTRGVSGCG